MHLSYLLLFLFLLWLIYFDFLLFRLYFRYFVLFVSVEFHLWISRARFCLKLQSKGENKTECVCYVGLVLRDLLAAQMLINSCSLIQLLKLTYIFKAKNYMKKLYLSQHKTPKASCLISTQYPASIIFIKTLELSFLVDFNYNLLVHHFSTLFSLFTYRPLR